MHENSIDKGPLWHYSMPTLQKIACQQVILVHHVQLFRQAEKANSGAVLHLPDEEDPGRLGAGEDGMP